MERKAYLKELLKQKSASSENSNIRFLKKYILLLKMGELRINGHSPNAKFDLWEYILDDHRTLIDWSRLSQKQAIRLKRWLFMSEESVLHTRVFTPYKISEVRGRPEEIRLGFWERLYNAIYFRRRYYTIPFRFDLTPDSYALKDIDIALSRQGALIDLVPRIQLLSKESLRPTEEYQDEGDRNVKRLILNDEMVDCLLSKSISDIDYTEVVSRPHPHAIQSHYPQRRLYRMREYRRDNQYVHRSNLLVRLWRFVSHWFWGVIRQSQYVKTKVEFKKLCEIENKSIYLEKKKGERTDNIINREIYVTEPRPPVNVFVFSGGGSKIFGHLGALKIAKEKGLSADIFAGSSSGAIISMLLYLGYTPDEIAKEFSYIKDDILIDVDVQRAGISTTRNLKSAINYFVQNKILEIVNNNKSCFETAEGKQFVIKYLYERKYTFRSLEILRRICPDAGIGKGLFVTGSDVTAQERKVFSLETTPDMEIAEAVKISGSMPVLYHPTDIDGHVYTDGGCMENTPVGLEHLFSKVNNFIEHEFGANLSVLAFQFDNGVETDVLHSAKPVYREHWLLNKIYEFATRVKDPASWWVRERRELRKYACQTIIIKTDGVKASKFDIDHIVQNQLDEFGKQGARDYIEPRFKQDTELAGSTRDGLYRRFENIEELMYYCVYKKEWSFLTKLMAFIHDPENAFDTEYVSYLQKVKIRLLEERKRNRMMLQETKGRWKRVMKTKLQPLFQVTDRTFDDVAYHTGLYCLLYSLLVSDWTKLRLAEYDDLLRPHITALIGFRHAIMKDQIDDTQVALHLTDMSQYFSEMKGETHIILYLLKVLLVHCQTGAISDVELDLRGLRDIMGTLAELDQITDKSILIGEWGFGLDKTRTLIQLLTSSTQNKIDHFVNTIKVLGYKKVNKDTMRTYASDSVSNESDIKDETRLPTTLNL